MSFEPAESRPRTCGALRRELQLDRHWEKKKKTACATTPRASHHAGDLRAPVAALGLGRPAAAVRCHGHVRRWKRLASERDRRREWQDPPEPVDAHRRGLLQPLLLERRLPHSKRLGPRERGRGVLVRAERARDETRAVPHRWLPRATAPLPDTASDTAVARGSWSSAFRRGARFLRSGRDARPSRDSAAALGDVRHGRDGRQQHGRRLRLTLLPQLELRGLLLRQRRQDLLPPARAPPDHRKRVGPDERGVRVSRQLAGPRAPVSRIGKVPQ